MAWLREQRVPIIELDCSGTPAEVREQLRTLLYSYPCPCPYPCPYPYPYPYAYPYP